MKFTRKGITPTLMSAIQKRTLFCLVLEHTNPTNTQNKETTGSSKAALTSSLD